MCSCRQYGHPPANQVYGNGSQAKFQSNPQQQFQNYSQPQYPGPQQFQSNSQPQYGPQQPAQSQAIVGPQYCSPYPTTFFVKDTLLSWSGDDANILDGNGSLAYSIDGKALSLRGSRVLKDAEGNSVCAMQSKVMLPTMQNMLCTHAFRLLLKIRCVIASCMMLSAFAYITSILTPSQQCKIVLL